MGLPRGATGTQELIDFSSSNSVALELDAAGTHCASSPSFRAGAHTLSTPFYAVSYTITLV